MQGVQRRLVDDAKAFGIEIVDMRIKRVDFPGSVVDSVYQRMQSERQQVASQLRATGEAEGEQLRANAERQRDEITAGAFSSAEKIKGDADGQANAIYAAAFGKDPSFANFYRSLQAYKASFNKNSDVVVTDGSSEFFRVLRSGGKAN
jgi:membrane protease subunit HflC